jgi:uncharacterized membrane protein YhfC
MEIRPGFEQNPDVLLLSHRLGHKAHGLAFSVGHGSLAAGYGFMKVIHELNQS